MNKLGILGIVIAAALIPFNIQTFADTNVAKAEFYFIEGLSDLKFGEYKKAIRHFDQAINLDPNYIDAYVNKGIALHELGNIEEAISNYDKALEIEPDDPITLNNKGYVFSTMEKYDEAVPYYKRALESDPTYLDALYNLADAFWEQWYCQDAIVYYDKIIEIDPEPSQAYLRKAWALSSLGLVEDAISNLDIALSSDPNILKPFDHTFVAMIDQNRFNEEFWENLLQQHPNVWKGVNNKSVSFIVAQMGKAELDTVCIKPGGPDLYEVVDTQTSTQFKTFENSLDGFKIKYPSDWVAIQTQDPYVKATFDAPLEGYYDEFKENALVSIDTFASPITLDDFLNLFHQDMKSLTDYYKVIETTDTTLAGYPAKKVVFDTSVFGIDGRNLRVSTIVGNQAYSFAFFGEEKNFESYLPTVEQMIDSFELTGGPTQISGKYSIPEVGLEIELPEGWAGIETKDKVTTLFVTPGILIKPGTQSTEISAMIEFVAMTIMSGEGSEIKEKIEQTSLQIDCKPSSSKVVYVNGMKATASFYDCNDPSFGKAQGIDYTFATKEKIIVVSYVALSSDPNKTYEEELSKFEDSLKTLKIKNTINLSEPSKYAQLFGYTYTSYPVLVDNKMRDVEIVSQTRIDKFSFNEANNEISLRIVPQEDSTEVTTVYVDDFLNPPYTVLEDGYKEIDDYEVLEDQTSNRVGIVFLDHKGAFTIRGSAITLPLVNDQAAELQIPEWIKSNAYWWADGLIADSDFSVGIEHLIKEGVISIPDLPESTGTTQEEIPDWIKNNARWWADGLISDEDFVSGLKYMVEQGIIAV